MNTKSIKFPFYFKTHDGLFCHTISEDCHFNDGIIGLPKYFPTNSTEYGRLIQGRPYFDHLPTFHDSIERTRQQYSHYLQYIERFGEELCVFYQKDIDETFDPRKKALEIYSGKTGADTQILRDTKQLLDITIKCFNISINDIGIEGSILLDCPKDISDIDVVIYGREPSQKVVNHFHQLSRYPAIHLYDTSDIDLIFSRRYKYRSFNTNQELLAQEKRRTVGLINGRRFWLQPILGSPRLEHNYHDRRCSKVGIVDTDFEVIDDRNARLWPTFYTLRNQNDGLVTMECYDPIYMNQARKGDVVHVRANIYLDLETHEKIVIVGPWIDTSQYLRIVNSNR